MLLRENASPKSILSQPSPLIQSLVSTFLFFCAVCRESAAIAGPYLMTLGQSFSALKAGASRQGVVHVANHKM